MEIKKCYKTQSGSYHNHTISNLADLDKYDLLILELAPIAGSFVSVGVNFYDAKTLEDIWLVVTSHSYVFKKNGELKAFYKQILKSINEEKLKSFCFKHKIKIGV